MRQFIALQVAWFDEQDRVSQLPAYMAAAYYNTHRAKGKPLKATKDFMPDNPFRDRRTAQTPESQCETLKHVTMASGGEIKYIQANGNEYTGIV